MISTVLALVEWCMRVRVVSRAAVRAIARVCQSVMIHAGWCNAE